VPPGYRKEYACECEAGALKEFFRRPSPSGMVGPGFCALGAQEPSWWRKVFLTQGFRTLSSRGRVLGGAPWDLLLGRQRKKQVGHDYDPWGLRVMDRARIARARHPFGGQMLRAFYTRGFLRIWSGSMLWYSVRWMEVFVLQWQVLVMTDSAFQVALVGFYRMAPLFFFGLLTGLIADRFDRWKVMLFAQLWNAVMASTIAVLSLTDSLALWHLAILMMALGVGWALDMPSRRSIIYDMMGPRRVVNAMALDHLGMDGARMLGPVLGGVLWPIVGLGGCFLLVTMGYVVNFFIYLGLSRFEPKRTVGSGPLLSNLAEGLRYVFRHPVILGVLGITGVLNFLAFPYQNLVPVVAKNVLGLGPRLTGLLIAGEGIGAISGSLFIASRGDVKYKGRAFVIASTLVLAAVLLLSLSRWYLVSFVLLFIAGIGIAVFATMQSSLILLSSDASMRGRAMGTLILAIGLSPLGALQAGALASSLGAATAITVITAAGLVLLVAIVWRATPLWNDGRNSHQPATARGK